MQMRYLFCFLLFFALLPEMQAQRSFFNSDEFWATFRLDTTPPPALSIQDTAIVVASSRVIHATDTKRFVGEERDGGKMHWYFVYSVKSTWHVLPVNNLTQALKYMPDVNRDWVLYADGYGKIFTSSVDRGMRMAAQHGVNMLYLDYPSFNSSKKLLGNYQFAFRNARRAYKDFVPILDSVVRLRKEGNMGNGHLALFFHSMGNNILRETVRKGRLPEINSTVWVDNLVLNAPCVPQKHHKEWLDKVQFAKRIYVHYNPEDHVLKGAHLVSFRKQLGEKVRKPISEHAAYINFHPLAGENHSNFLVLLQHPVPQQSLLAYYHSLLHGNAVNIADTIHFRRSGYRGIGVEFVE